MSNISLPQTAKEYMERQVIKLQLNSFNNYILQLIQQEQNSEYFEPLILGGLDSGVATQMEANDWERIRQTVRQN